MVSDAIGKPPKIAVKAAKAIDAVATAGKISAGAARTADVVGGALKAGKGMAQSGLRNATDKVLDAGRSMGFRVPTTACNVPIINKLANACFVPGTLVIVCGETALEVLAAEQATSVPPVVVAGNQDDEDKVGAAIAGLTELSPAELGAAAVVAIGLAASGAVKRRRRRMALARDCDKLLGEAQDGELGPEADMDQQLLIEQAAAIADALRDRELAARSEALQRLVEESPVAAQTCPSIARRSTHRPHSVEVYHAGRIVVPGSRFEAAVARGELRAGRHREERRRAHRVTAALSSPTALAAWCVLAIVTWWALPKTWGELTADAERGTRTAKATSTDAGALHLTPVTATSELARDALRQRALADPLSVQAYKAIEEIRPGDLVLARDDDGESLVARPVTQRFERRSDHLRTVTYLAADGEERALKTTDEHPFWVADRGWTPAKDLSPGDEFQQANGDTAILLGTEFDAETDGTLVYNFEVAGAHNYFVAAPNTIRGPPGLASIDATLAETGLGDAVLVHNTCQNIEGAVGRYRDLVRRGSKGDNLTPHHVPSALHMSRHGVSKGDGISINMIGGRHRMTFTYGTRADAGLSNRDALARGIRDMRRIYQREGLYDAGMRQQFQRLIELNKNTFPGLFAR